MDEMIKMSSSSSKTGDIEDEMGKLNVSSSKTAENEDEKPRSGQEGPTNTKKARKKLTSLSCTPARNRTGTVRTGI